MEIARTALNPFSSVEESVQKRGKYRTKWCLQSLFFNSNLFKQYKINPADPHFVLSVCISFQSWLVGVLKPNRTHTNTHTWMVLRRHDFETEKKVGAMGMVRKRKRKIIWFNLKISFKVQYVYIVNIRCFSELHRTVQQNLSLVIGKQVWKFLFLPELLSSVL